MIYGKKHAVNDSRTIVEVGIGIVLRLVAGEARITTENPMEVLQVLLTRRREGTVYAGYWEFPGGKVARGEGIDACVQRELSEEAGISAEVIGSLGDITHEYPHGVVRLHPRLCRLARGSPEPTNLQVAEHRWAGLDELASFRFPEANEEIVRQLVVSAGSGGLIELVELGPSASDGTGGAQGSGGR